VERPDHGIQVRGVRRSVEAVKGDGLIEAQTCRFVDGGGPKGATIAAIMEAMRIPTHRGQRSDASRTRFQTIADSVPMIADSGG
jgi:hypothetical protein